jgi:uncharacterized protein (TIGR02231 family)
MKRIICLLIIALLATVQSFAQELQANSKITQVTIYRQQARETRTSTVTIPVGNTDVVLSGIATSMIDQSLQVGVKGDATLLSATVRTNHFTLSDISPNDAKIERLRDSIDFIRVKLSWLQEERGIHNGELNLVTQLLQPNNSKEGYKPADLSAMADIYRERFSDLKKKLFDIGQKEIELNKRITKFQNQINDMAPKAKAPVKEIVLSFSSETGGTLTLRTSYLVTSASWEPMYDLHVANTSQPVHLNYRAKIAQSTGVDWKDVELTLSTGNPSLNNNRPIMSPVYVDYVQYRVQNNEGYYQYGAASNSMNMPMINDKKLEEPKVPVVIETESEIQVEFAIDARQNIPSDGKEHVCSLKTHDIPAIYRYHVVPKLDNGAFLLAKITDYGKYNLLPGTANVFYGETFIGAVAINPTITSDTLLISLGRDERIVVKRSRSTEKCSTKLFSGKKKETYAYDITIRNNKSTGIDIEVLDQIPLTRRKEIEVEMIDSDGANYTEKIGKVIWNFKLKPNDTKILHLVYSVELKNANSRFKI